MSKTTTAFSIILGLAVVFAPGACAQAPEVAPASPRFEVGDSVGGLSVDIFDRIVYLPVALNGAGPFTFVLDTGAGGISAVDRAVADSLGLAVETFTTAGGAGEEAVEVGRADSLTIELPGVSFTDRTVFTLPLHRMDRHWGKTKDGVIGGDLLSTLVTRIDYENETIDFHDAATYEHTGAGEAIPLVVVGNFLFVEAKVFLFGKARPINAFLMVDTGVRLSLFNTWYANRYNLAAQSPKTTTGIMGFGLGGVSRGTVGRVRGIELGSIRLENPVVDFSIDEAGALADTSFSGIIGADILHRFHVVIDYSRSRMVLEKNRFFGDPFEFDMSGIRFVMDGPGFESLRVYSIFEGSPAAEAGLEEGDMVTRIDGREAAQFTRETLREYLEREGRDVVLSVERDGKTHEIKIRLKRLV
jgi:hypothetical protein